MHNGVFTHLTMKYDAIYSVFVFLIQGKMLLSLKLYSGYKKLHFLHEINHYSLSFILLWPWFVIPIK